MEKMRKLHCEEMLKKGFDDLPYKTVKNMAGYYYPEKKGKKIGWEVTTLWEGEGYTANSQFEAEVIANQNEIIGLLLKSVTCRDKSPKENTNKSPKISEK